MAEQGIDVVHQPMPVSPKEPSLLRRVGAPVVIGPMNGGMGFPPAFSGRQGRSTRWVIGLGRAGADLANRWRPASRRPNCCSWPTSARGEPCRSALGAREQAGRKRRRPGAVAAAVARSAALACRCDFAFVGRLVDWKAVDCLLEAFDAARGSAPMA